MTPDFLTIPAMPARRWSWSRTAHCLLHLGALTSLPAMAAADDVFRPYIGYALSQDDNVLGVGDGSTTTGGSTSALSRHAEAGLFVNERLSQQVITAALKFSHITYDELPELNNDGKDLLVNWNWHIGNHLDGNIGSSYVQALTPFVNFHSRERNLRAERRQFVDGGWLFHPSWRVRAGASRDALTYDLASQQGGNRVENVLEAGLDYLAPSGSTFGTQLRHTRGEFPNRQQIGAVLVDNSYNQDEIKARISWLVTAKTQLQFLGGLVQRNHETFPSRDYSGFNARLTTIWQASAKTGVTAAAWREIGALDDVTASYTLNQGLSLGSTWDVTDKIRLEGQLKRETSDYSGAAVIPSVQGERKDTVRRAEIKMTYKPTPALQLVAQAYHGDRSSTLAGNSYPGSGVLLATRYEF